MTELTSGARYDKNKLPDQLAWDKSRTEKVQVMEKTPPKMYVVSLSSIALEELIWFLARVDKLRDPTGLN